MQSQCRPWSHSRAVSCSPSAPPRRSLRDSARRTAVRTERRQPVHPRRVRRRPRRAIRRAVDPAHPAGRLGARRRRRHRHVGARRRRVVRVDRRLRARSMARADEAHSVHAVVDVAGPSFFRFRCRRLDEPDRTGRPDRRPTRRSSASPRRAASTSRPGSTPPTATSPRGHPTSSSSSATSSTSTAGRTSAVTSCAATAAARRSRSTSTAQRYALYLSDPQLQAARAVCPWLAIWDDHEVENNYAASTSEDAAPAGRVRRPPPRRLPGVVGAHARAHPPAHRRPTTRSSTARSAGVRSPT